MVRAFGLHYHIQQAAPQEYTSSIALFISTLPVDGQRLIDMQRTRDVWMCILRWSRIQRPAPILVGQSDAGVGIGTLIGDRGYLARK